MTIIEFVELFKVSVRFNLATDTNELMLKGSRQLSYSQNHSIAEILS